MSIEKSTIEAYTLSGLTEVPEGVTLYLQSISPTEGRMTIVSFARAWTAHYNDLKENESVTDRFMSLTPENQRKHFHWAFPEISIRDRTKESAYLATIINTVRAEIARSIKGGQRV